MDDLKLGKTLTISFPTAERKAADDYSIPFSLKELPNLLRRFSNDAKSMEQTLRVCEDSPTKGETKYCATSVEAMRDFVQHILGEKTQIEALTTMKTHSEEYSSTPLNHDHLQNYTILNHDPEDVGATKMVACHTMPSVYYCHHTSSKSKVLKVSLRNDANGYKIEAIAVCHLDTSDWNPSHLSFRVLGILPGTSPICHFFPSSNDLVWIPKSVAAF
uniref:BURP domain-containing protein n=1 Tax=Solanum chacoense TaxID=4108 RepID=A0A0V0HQ68_SOLCH